MDGIEDTHLDQHSSTRTARNPPDPATTNQDSVNDPLPATATTSTTAPNTNTSTRRTRASVTKPSAAAATETDAEEIAPRPRRSARFSLSRPATDDTPTAAAAKSAEKRKQKLPDSSEAETTGSKRKRTTAAPPKPLTLSPGPIDRKGKGKQKQEDSAPSSPLTDIDAPDAPLAKRTRNSVRSKADIAASSTASLPAVGTASQKGKGKAVARPRRSTRMPKKTTTPKNTRAGQASSNAQRTKKGDHTPRQLVDDDMEGDDGRWTSEAGPSRSRLMDDDDEDEDMSHSDDNDEDHSEDDEDDGEGDGADAARMSALDRFTQLAAQSGMNLDDATTAAIFGNEFRGLGNFMSGLNSRFKRLRNDLRAKSTSTRLAALRDCSEVLLVSNEDTLGGAFSASSFATEFIAILNGKPNVDASSRAPPADDEDMDEDAMLARALAMSTEGEVPGMGVENDEMECQLLACRCLAHLMEALPGSGHTLVHLGAVPVLCSKLNEPSYIELAEQTLSTMEKVSAEYPSAIVREGGLEALLRFLDFFSTNVQRTAVQAAANCCKNISSEHYAQVKAVFPTLRSVLTQTDQRLVEAATLAVVRVLESYRSNSEHLEGLLELETVVAINALLVPSGGSPLISSGTYTHLLRALTSSARGSAKVTIAFLEAGMTSTVYQILTGVLPPAHNEDEQGMSPGGQGLAGGIADMAVLQNLAHRPKDQVEEALALICELLPPTTKEGVFDSKAYTEKALNKLIKGRKTGTTERPATTVRRSSRNANAGTDSQGPSTPNPSTPTAAPAAGASTGNAAEDRMAAAIAGRDAALQAAIKQKRDAEALAEKRLELLSEQYKLFERFIRAIVPVLVDVYAASVAARVRTKVLTGLLRAMAFAKPDEMRRTLQAVPMASFLGTIISSKDNHTYVLAALQLVELLSTRLPEIYKQNFAREGVVFEIEVLAKLELTTTKAAKEKELAEAAAKVKSEPMDDAPPASSSTPDAGSSAAAALATPTPAPTLGMAGGFRAAASGQDIKPVIGPDGVPTTLSQFFANQSSALPSSVLGSLPKKYTILDPQDANILRARVMLVKKLFDLEGSDSSAATAVLDKLAQHVAILRKADSSDGHLRDALRDIANRFTNAEHSLSSFELLQSGLVDGLLDFVDVDGVVPSAERRAMLFETFSTSLTAASSPLAMLVKRLHESLGRLEAFEVETAFNGVADTSRFASSLGRTIRLRLQPEDGPDPARATAAISVTIQAIATIQALHDYLRSRVGSDGYFSNSGMAGLFGAYGGGMGIPRGSGTSADGRQSLYSVLKAAGAFGSSAPEASRPSMLRARGAAGGAAEGDEPSAAAAAASGSGAGAGTGAGAGATASEDTGAAGKPQRRRSARISAAQAGSGDGAEEEEESGSQPQAIASASGAAGDVPALPLSSSAPEAGTLYGGMPMDMDMDDEYSDEEYDAEVYDDDFEEEMALVPREKIVNMSVAADGSKVEVKTPDGTRVATPSQNPAASAGPGPSAAASNSGAATPRTASYAGAVKTAPSDWHLEFSLNGKPLALNDTIYGAVHRSQAKNGSAAGAGAGAGVFATAVTFRFKKVDGPAPTAPEDAPSPAGTAGGMPSAFDAALPTTKILRLLRLVHGLSVEAHDAADGHHDLSLDEGMFVNNKLTAKLTRQLEETMIIASNCLPAWATELPKHFPFLFPFEARYSFLQNNSFGYSRLIARYQAAQRSGSSGRRDDLAHLSRIVRQKVRISRAQLLESAAKVLELYGTGSAILEVEYFDEIGTGLGPTLEFYSLASREFARRSLKVWRDEDESKEGEYVYHPKGLFPVPMSAEEAGAGGAGRVGWYKTLGLFVGRALLDSRIIDVNLNKVFLKLVLGAPVRKSIATLRQVDVALARSLERLQAYSQARKEIEALELPEETRQTKLLALTVNGAMLSDLSLDFTLPGYDIELKPDGAHVDVDDSNLDEYLESVLDMTLGSGVQAQVKAFQEGFSMIYPFKDMRIFSTDELGLLFGNSDEDWSKETIEHSIKADHGYNLDSRSVRSLIDVMAAYSKEERRQFLQFITGAPKLPIGGFRGLNPQFTVVRKPHEAPFRADDYLPSVMTCAQYLKLPDYSSREVLAAQLQRAMLDGGGSFHLS